jgi:hypothetical protein
MARLCQTISKDTLLVLIAPWFHPGNSWDSTGFILWFYSFISNPQRGTADI